MIIIVDYYCIFARSMLRLISFFFLFFYTFCGFAQTSNPFDIGAVRSVEDQLDQQNVIEDSISLSNQTTTRSEISNNPFDINKGTKSSVGEIPQRITETHRSNTAEKVRPSELVSLIYIIVVLCLLTFAISHNRNRFSSLLKSIFNSNSLKNLHKDNRAWTDLQSIILYALFITNSSYLLYLLNNHYFKGALPSIFVILLAVLAIYLLRHFAMMFISYVYGLGQEIDLHNFSIGVHNMVLGIVLVPFIMGYAFISNDMARIVFILLCAFVMGFYALRQIKGGLSIITSREFNVFYFFIYLCAVEIAPILITWKVVSGAL